MNIKEHLQFLAMMVPTFLLLGALALSLAFPTRLMGASVPAATALEVADAGRVAAASEP